jgi:hypothetical protein
MPCWPGVACLKLNDNSHSKSIFWSYSGNLERSQFDILSEKIEINYGNIGFFHYKMYAQVTDFTAWYNLGCLLAPWKVP